MTGAERYRPAGPVYPAGDRAGREDVRVRRQHDPAQQKLRRVHHHEPGVCGTDRGMYRNGFFVFGVRAVLIEASFLNETKHVLLSRFKQKCEKRRKIWTFNRGEKNTEKLRFPLFPHFFLLFNLDFSTNQKWKPSTTLASISTALTRDLLAKYYTCLCCCTLRAKRVASLYTAA